MITGWWFGCHEFYFPINIGFLIIPIDFHIFQRGGPTTNQIYMINIDQSDLHLAKLFAELSSVLKLLVSWVVLDEFCVL